MAENIKLNLSHNFNDAASGMARFGRSLNSVGNSFNGANKNLNRMQNGLRNLTTDANRSVTAFGNMSNALVKMNGLLNYAVVNRLANAFAKMTQGALDSTEVINMFNVAMGENALITGDFIKRINAATGLDQTTLQQAVGTYNVLARSMGVGANNAKTLSENTTQLALDLSSLFNTPFAQTLADLKSGLVGQSETVYKYGVDVTEAALKQEALRLGIDAQVRGMSQGEKMALRYSTMIRQTSLSHTDFAVTIDAASNQLRILGERLTTMGRTIGSVVIPALTSVLPYINAIVGAVTELFGMLAAILGYIPPEVEVVGRGIGAVADGVDDIGDSADGSAKKMDALKKSMNALPFDELNTLSPDTNSSKAASGAASDYGGFGDLGVQLDGYESKILSVKQRADELKKSIMEWLGFQQRVNEATGELEWKLKNGYTNFEKIKDIVSTIGTLLLAWKIRNSLLTDGTLLNGIFKGIKKLMLEMPILMSWIKEYGAKGFLTEFFDKDKLVMAGWLAVITVCIARAKYLWETSSYFRLGMQTIVSGIGNSLINLKEKTFGVLSAIGGFFKSLVPPEVVDAFRSVGEKISSVAKAMQLDFGDLGLTIAGIVLALNPATAAFGAALLIFETVTLAIRAVGFAASDVVESIDVLGEASEETQKKMQPMLDRLRHLDNIMSEIEFTGEIITQDVVDNVASKTAAIRENILNELDSDRNSALETLAPLKAALGDDAYQELIDNNNSYYDTIQKNIETGEARINEIVTLAKNENRTLNQSELDEISTIQDKMQSVTVTHFSETEVEANAIMNRMKDNTTRVSLEQASEIIKNAKTTRDETVSAAETQYSKIQLEAQAMLETSSITKEQYDTIMAAAAKTRDETVKSAETQYNKIESTTKTKMGDIANCIDYESGEIRSKWAVGWENMGLVVSTFFKESLTKSESKLTELRQKFNSRLSEIRSNWSTSWESATSSFNNFIETSKRDFNDWWNNHVTKWFSFDTWKQLGKDAVDGLFRGIGDLWEKAKNLGKDFVDGFRSKDGIDSHSPSKEFERVGEDIVAGLSIPLDNMESLGVNAASKLVDGFSECKSGLVSVAQDAASEIEKVFQGISYNPNIDYSELIGTAVAGGDLKQAAILEQKRNAKIDNESMSYAKTNTYSSYLEDAVDVTNEHLAESVEVQTKLADYSSGMNTLFDDFGKTYSGYEKADTDLTNNLYSKGVEFVTKLNADFTKLYKSMSDVTNTNIKNGTSQIVTANNTGVGNIMSRLSDVITAINNVRINITYNYYSSGSKLARGGMVDRGDIFEAGENGKSELIGSHAGKTTVMPLENTGFVSAIYDAVYSAMQSSAASNSGGAVIENILNLDGEVIYRNQQKVSSKKGVSFSSPAFQR